MTEITALEPRVAALEGLLDRIRMDLCEARTLAAGANLNATNARFALRSVERDLDGCRQLLTDLAQRLEPEHARHVEFVVGRLDKALRTIALDG